MTPRLKALHERINARAGIVEKPDPGRWFEVRPNILVYSPSGVAPVLIDMSEPESVYPAGMA